MICNLCLKTHSAHPHLHPAKNKAWQQGPFLCRLAICGWQLKGQLNQAPREGTAGREYLRNQGKPLSKWSEEGGSVKCKSHHISPVVSVHSYKPHFFSFPIVILLIYFFSQPQPVFALFSLTLAHTLFFILPHNTCIHSLFSLLCFLAPRSPSPSQCRHLLCFRLSLNIPR